MQALRSRFPSARIAVLGKPHARPLLEGAEFVDEVFTFDFPWTAFKNKWRPSRYSISSFRQLFAELRNRNFDVSIDARRDIRSNLVTYFAGAKRRIGYDFGGGAHLLTDVLPSGDQGAHKVDDWLALLAPLGISTARTFRPRLNVSAEERERARASLSSLGVSGSRPVIGVHRGASLPSREWGRDRFAAAARLISAERDVDWVIFEERTREGRETSSSEDGIPIVKTTLRELMALITQCDLFLCNDSGPMHIASALQVPVTGLFGSGRKEWYGPVGDLDVAVDAEMTCRPCFDACIFATPHCLEAISPTDVARVAVSQLDSITARRELAAAR